jgi:hypothetical protein
VKWSGQTVRISQEIDTDGVAVRLNVLVRGGSLLVEQIFAVSDEQTWG